MDGESDLPSEPPDQLAPATHADESETRQHLFTLAYDELRRIAQRELRRMGPALTLSATTLLHEVYLNLREREGVLFLDRPRFLAYASRAMRGLVIDYARSRQALKRGSGFEITSLPTEVPEDVQECAELDRLSDALDQLETVDARLAQVVDLKYFS